MNSPSCSVSSTLVPLSPEQERLMRRVNRLAKYLTKYLDAGLMSWLNYRVSGEIYYRYYTTFRGVNIVIDPDSISFNEHSSHYRGMGCLVEDITTLYNKLESGTSFLLFDDIYRRITTNDAFSD